MDSIASTHTPQTASSSLITPEELARRLKKTNIAMDKASAKVAALSKERDNLLRETILTCEFNHAFGHGCGSQHRLGDLTYIQTHWYERPHGCSGGDTWHSGEGQYVCPACGHRNRLYDKPEIAKLKRLFKNVEDEFRQS